MMWSIKSNSDAFRDADRRSVLLAVIAVVAIFAIYKGQQPFAMRTAMYLLPR